MSTTIHDVLVNARALIADPANWTQGALAIGSDGKSRSSTSPTACAFCAVGAIRRAAHADPEASLFADDAAVGYLATCLPGDAFGQTSNSETDVTTFNDNHSHDEVIAAFDSAIAVAAAAARRNADIVAAAAAHVDAKLVE